MKLVKIIKLGLRSSLLFVCSICFFAFANNTKAQNAGQLDPTFGIGGKVSTVVPLAAWGNQTASILLPDGKILTATGFMRSPATPFVAVARYLSDGTLDNSWGDNGISITEVNNSLSLRISDIKLLPDGKILAAGFRDSIIGGFPITGQYILKYQSDGTLDVSFGEGGKVALYAESATTVIYKIVIVDNKIIAIGRRNSQTLLNAFNITTGALDVTWGNNGVVLHDVSAILAPVQSVIVTPDNNILVAEQGRIYRYLSNGEIDSSFGRNGIDYIEPLYAVNNNSSLIHSSLGNSYGLTMILQPDAKIIVAGIASPYSIYGGKGVLERYYANGELDSTFADNGVLAVDFRSADLGVNYINQIVADSNGNIIVAGNAKDTISGRLYFALAKYDIQGQIDSSFGINGMNTVSFHNSDSIDFCYEILAQLDGKIILTGFTPMFSAAVNNIPLGSFSLARFQSGILSTIGSYRENLPKVVIFPNPLVSQFTINSPQLAIKKLSIYTVQGQEQKNISYSGSEGQIRVDMTEYPDAVYFLRIYFENGQSTVHKIVKAR